MKLHKAFTRVKPAGGVGTVTLGADGAPSGAPGATETATGNAARLPLYDAHGNPLQGVAVAVRYTGGGGAPATVVGALWAYDETSAAWFRLTAAAEAFEVNRLASYPIAGGGYRGGYGGDVVVALVPTDASYADGSYTFVLGADYVARGASASAGGGGGGGTVFDGNVNVASKSFATTRSVSATYEETRVLKAAAGKLYGIAVGNKHTADLYLCLFDKATAPAPGDALAFPPTLVPAGGVIGVNSPDGLSFAAGIACALSTSQAAYAAVGATHMFVRGEYT